MSAEISVRPEEVWGLFQKNLARLTDVMLSVGEDPDSGVAVYLTEDRGSPRFVVCLGDDVLYEESAVSESDCALTARRLYDRYLSGSWSAAAPEETDAREDEMEERESALTMAALDFLGVLLDGVGDAAEELDYDQVSDFLDGVCTLLAEDCGISVYRPMYVTDPDTGGEVFTQYPYQDAAEGDILP